MECETRQVTQSDFEVIAQFARMTDDLPLSTVANLCDPYNIAAKWTVTVQGDEITELNKSWRDHDGKLQRRRWTKIDVPRVDSTKENDNWNWCLREELKIQAKHYRNNPLYINADDQIKHALLADLYKRIGDCQALLKNTSKEKMSEIFEQFRISSCMRNTICLNDSTITCWAKSIEVQRFPTTGDHDYTLFGEKMVTRKVCTNDLSAIFRLTNSSQPPETRLDIALNLTQHEDTVVTLIDGELDAATNSALGKSLCSKRSGLMDRLRRKALQERVENDQLPPDLLNWEQRFRPPEEWEKLLQQHLGIKIVDCLGEHSFSYFSHNLTPEPERHTLLGNLFERIIFCQCALTEEPQQAQTHFDYSRIPRFMRRFAIYKDKAYLLATLCSEKFEEKDAKVSAWARQLSKGKPAEQPKSVTDFKDLRDKGKDFTISGDEK